jgi:hypothetical protein
VFDQLVNTPNRAVTAQMAPASANFLYSLNEGWADYMAAARTGDPDFMSHTAPKGVFGVQCNSDGWVELVRDVAIAYYYNLGYDAEARSTDPAEYCPYDIGLVFASTMYGLARALEGLPNADYDAVPTRAATERVARWLYAAMADLGQTLTNDFELWDMFSLIVAHAETEQERQIACELIEDRYATYFAQVEGC